ncbi:uncharacterized protein N7482_006204 [Penicillium canariense]|uniref:Uncharacterized protein n=1 Tax=Penicillium canariense TaxID=189055 RepID=A0A9W9LP68_9EURO|nr:uncharacterized protein N7482_006204 [Penicillium canariense]KAJ5167423.1 hypothetical protein N7482_006204 [Penicillium canariense]
MDSPTRPIVSPSKVLHPVSPERMNQQTIPASPSLPADLLNLHHKNTKGVSEVQAKVAFLNSLSRGGSPMAHAQAAANNAALQRAILGREEAESALASVQEELSEAQSRERRISERLESLLEELHGTKERQAHERSIFEKEIRKARKEAFRAGSTLVKLQEELKHSKSETKALKDEVAAERESKDKAKQEAFERAYALAGLTEELEVLKGKLRSMEATNHSNTLEVRAHEIRTEDFGRISLAEGDLAFLTTPRRPKRAAVGSVKSSAPEKEADEIAEATPPKRQRLSECTTTAGLEETTTDILPSDLDDGILDELKDELDYERRRRVEAEEMVHFLNIECQFERCSCRIAESEGRRYIYDAEYFETFQKPQIEAEAKAARQALAREAHAHETHVHQMDPHPQSSHTPSVEPPAPVLHRPEPQAEPQSEPVVKSEPRDPPEKMQIPEEPLVTFSPETGTFKTFPSPLRDNAPPRRADFLPTPDLPDLHPSIKNWKDSSASSNYHADNSAPSEEPRSSRMVHATPAESIFSETTNARLSVESRPARHRERDYHQPTHSTTKRVPLREATDSRTSGSSSFAPDTPINREEALAQIAARRNRARSKQRSVSANEATGHSGSTGSTAPTPGRGPRRMPNLRADGKSENDLAERRDLSAPVRMSRR